MQYTHVLLHLFLVSLLVRKMENSLLIIISGALDFLFQNNSRTIKKNKLIRKAIRHAMCKMLDRLSQMN